MAYEPKTWVCDEDITDEDLNRIEEGVQEALGSGGFSFTISGAEYPYSCDKTYEEIANAIDARLPITAYRTDDTEYPVTVFTFGSVRKEEHAYGDVGAIKCEVWLQELGLANHYILITFTIRSDGEIHEEYVRENLDTGN